MTYLSNMIWVTLLIAAICSCKNDKATTPSKSNTPVVKTTSGGNANTDIYNELNLTDAQIKSVNNIERKSRLAKRKLMKEKKWDGPQNRPARAKHNKAKKKSLNKALGNELAKKYTKLITAKSKQK